MLHHFVVMNERFAKSKARVGNDVRHAMVAKLLGATCKIADHLRRHIIVMWLVLHIAGLALHVHQDIGNTEAAYGMKHGTV